MALVIRRSDIGATLLTFLGIIMITPSVVLADRVGWVGIQIVATKSFGFLTDG